MFIASEISENYGLLTNNVLNVFRKFYSRSVRCYIFRRYYPQRHSKHGRRHQEVVQDNSDFIIFRNHRINNFRTLDIYNLLRDWPQTVQYIYPRY